MSGQPTPVTRWRPPSPPWRPRMREPPLDLDALDEMESRLFGQAAHTMDSDVDDIGRLLAEVRRLHAENARLREENTAVLDAVGIAAQKIDRLRAVVEAARVHAGWCHDQAELCDALAALEAQDE